MSNQSDQVSESVATGSTLNTQDDELMSAHSNYREISPSDESLPWDFNELQLNSPESQTSNTYRYTDAQSGPMTSIIKFLKQRTETYNEMARVEIAVSPITNLEIRTKLKQIHASLKTKHDELNNRNYPSCSDWETLFGFSEKFVELLQHKRDAYNLSPSDDQCLKETLDEFQQFIQPFCQVVSHGDGIEIQNESGRGLLLGKCTPLQAINTTRNQTRSVYKLPVTLKYEDELHRIRKFETKVDNNKWRSKETKVIMMAGKTGEGKSLMVNRLVNYVFGVKYEDSFRLRLIVDDEEKLERRPEWSTGEGSSLTSWVTGYLLCWQKEFLQTIPYNLYLIDVPGFADSEGVRRDNEIVNQISKFLHSNSTSPHFLSAITFVVNATTSRLTEETVYVFDEVLKLYSKDFIENVFILFSNSDEEEDPKALESIRRHNIIFNDFYKFNNSIYSAIDSKMAEAKWEMGEESMKKFFERLASVQSKDIQSTLAVLQYRDTLQLILREQESRINDSMQKLTQMQETIEAIAKLKSEANQNVNFTFEVEELVVKRQKVNHFSLVCFNCEETCHSNCNCKFGEASPWYCQVFYWISGCKVCSNNCGSSSHRKLKAEFRQVSVKKMRTIEDMMTAYNIATDAANWQVNLLKGLLSEYRVSKNRALQNINEATDLTNRLNQIAMRNRNMSVVGYIDSLICKEEKNQNRPDKLDFLRTFRNIAQREQQIKDGELSYSSLASQLSESEVNMQKSLHGFGIFEVYLV